METIDPTQFDLLSYHFRSNVVGVPRKDRTVVGESRVYENSFLGKEAVDWFVLERGCSREVAVNFGETLLRQGVIIALNGTNFVDKWHAYYSFSEVQPAKLRPSASRKQLRSEAVVDTEENRKLKEKIQTQFSGQILAVVTVLPTQPKSKKGSEQVLCISEDATKGVFSVSHLKSGKKADEKPEGGQDDPYVAVKVWKGLTLKSVEWLDHQDTIDGAQPTTNRFTLSWEKPYIFETQVANTYFLKLFIWVLLTLSEKYGILPTTSINLVQLQLELHEANKEFKGVPGMAVDDSQAFITQEEEEEIKRLLESSHQWDVNVLATEFSNSIQKLETDNVHLLIGPQNAIATKDIVKSLKMSGKRTGVVKEYFTELERILDSEDIRKDVNQIEKKNKDLQVYTKNLTDLSKKLTQLVHEITVDDFTMKAIDNPQFETEPERAIVAAQRLRHLLGVDLGPMNQMMVVVEQRKMFQTKSAEFLSKFTNFISKFFESKQQSYLSQKKSTITASNILKGENHLPLHEAFSVYKDLVHWVMELKSSTPKIDKNDIQNKYCDYMATIYKAEFKYMFRVLDKRTEWKDVPPKFEFEHIGSTIKTVGSGVASALTFIPTLGTSVVTGAATGTVQVVSNVIWTEREDDSFSDLSEEGKKKVRIKRLGVEKCYPLALRRSLRKVQLEEVFIRSFFKAWNEEQAKHYDESLNHIFDGLLDELIEVITRQFELNPFLCIQLEIETSKMEKKYLKTSTFIESILSKCRTKIVTSWNSYLEEQKMRIETSKAIRTTGILGPTTRLLDAIKTIDSTHAGAASTLVEPAYRGLIKSVFNWILKTVADTTQVDRLFPSRQKLVVRIENFHFLYTKMASFKIPMLDPFIEEATQHYNVALSAFVEDMAMECLGQLNAFFSAVEKIYNGVNQGQYDTIQFNSSTTNQKLVSTVAKVHLIHIEKAMFELYKKGNKTMGPGSEENLFPQVWNAFKNHMIKTYQRYEFLVSECYKGKSLAFSVVDLQKSMENVLSRWEARQQQASKDKHDHTPGQPSSSSSEDSEHSSSRFRTVKTLGHNLFRSDKSMEASQGEEKRRNKPEKSDKPKTAIDVVPPDTERGGKNTSSDTGGRKLKIPRPSSAKFETSKDSASMENHKKSSKPLSPKVKEESPRKTGRAQSAKFEKRKGFEDDSESLTLKEIKPDSKPLSVQREDSKKTSPRPSTKLLDGDNNDKKHSKSRTSRSTSSKRDADGSESNQTL